MAKKQTKTKVEEPKQTDDSKLFGELISQYNESDRDLTNFRDGGFTWTEREEMFMGVLADAGSNSTKSNVNTQDLCNIVLDGAARVMAQLPTGQIRAITEDDRGKSILMNIVHEKYIIPNADAQYDFLTKLRLWDIYSRVFGSMPALVDYRVTDDYIGPDLWLIHPRSFFPQAGAVNMSDMQYCQVSTWVSVEYLESRDPKVWKNLKELIKKVKTGSKTKSSQDTKYIPYNQINSSLTAEKGKYGQVELRTRYECDRWVTYAPDYELVVRDIPNPQGNNELPVVMKHCFPVIDRLYGIAEFERGYTLQYAANSLINMFMDGRRMAIYPPLMLDATGVVPSTIEYKAGAKWLMTKPNSIEQFKSDPQVTKDFISSYGFIKSAILNMSATADTAINAQNVPTKGKSPAAIKKQNSQESARDNWDRFMMEQALEEVTNRFISLLTTKQEKPIELSIFGDDIKKIQEAYPEEKDIVTIFNSGEAGKITIKKEMWNESKFHYIIDPGSTKKIDENAEYDALTELFGLLLKLPDAEKQIMETGKVTIGQKEIDFGYALKRYIVSSGIQDGEKIIYDSKEGQSSQDQQNPDEIGQLKKQMEQVAQIVSQLAQKAQQPPPAQAKPAKPVSETMSYKDVPEDVKRQIEAQAGLKPSQIGANPILNQIHQMTPGAPQQGIPSAPTQSAPAMPPQMTPLQPGGQPGGQPALMPQQQ